MTTQQIEQKYRGLQIVTCKATSEVGETGMYIFIYPAINQRPELVKTVLDNAVRDFVGNNSYHEYISSSKDDCYVRIIIADTNSLIPPRTVATITITHM